METRVIYVAAPKSYSNYDFFKNRLIWYQQEKQGFDSIVCSPSSGGQNLCRRFGKESGVKVEVVPINYSDGVSAGFKAISDCVIRCSAIVVFHDGADSALELVTKRNKHVSKPVSIITV